MDVLYPTKPIVKAEFSGKLMIDGDLEDNCILFRFVFDKPEQVHPLLITIRALPLSSLESFSEGYGSRHVFECNIPDIRNSVIKTCLLYPELLLREHKIEVVDIDSQVSCCIC
jgi:hypothetical protein